MSRVTKITAPRRLEFFYAGKATRLQIEPPVSSRYLYERDGHPSAMDKKASAAFNSPRNGSKAQKHSEAKVQS